MTSLRHQLTLRLVLSFALLLGAGGGAIYFSERVALYRELDARLKLKALAMAALTKPERSEVDFEYPRRILTLEGGTNMVEYYQLFAANGVSLVRSPALGEVGLPQRFGSLNSPRFWNLSLPDGTPGRAVGVRFLARPPLKLKKPKDPAPKAEDKPPGKEPKPPPPEPVEVGLVMAEQRVQLDAQLSRLGLLLFGAGVLMLAATVLLVPWVLGGGLTPLRRLAAHVASLDATTLAQRFPTDRLPAELAPIVGRLNELLGRLEGSFERERRFSADLAHEMRTPLAGLRACAEVALKFPSAANTETLQSVVEISRQMEAMLARMLTLARSEQKVIPLRKESVPLAQAVRRVWGALAARAAERSISCRASVPESARLQTDTMLFQGLLANLLSNAVEHSPKGSTVHVEFIAGASRHLLVVRNPAPGLDAFDLAHFFERFWRKDPARTDSDHAGLGLALAKSFAELLGLKLDAGLESGAVLLRVAIPT